jgi:hypothetical protein
MNKKYVIDDGSSLKIIGANHFPSSPLYVKVVELPNNMYNEDVRWLQIEQVDGADTVTINEALKSSIQIEDAENAAAAADAEQHRAKVIAKKERIDRGIEMKAEIAVLNETKDWTDDEFAAYLSDPRVQQISLLLSNGALQTAKSVIQGVNFSAYYDQSDMDEILAKLQALIDQG